jgi:hypothetical protein
LSLVNKDGTTIGVLSVNNLLSNSAVGGVTLVASDDLSNDSLNLKIGTMTLDLPDAATIGTVFGIVSASFSDADGNLASIPSLAVDIY